MTKALKLSVIIPVYNGSKYIDECLTSVIASVSPEIEYIIVDDGSTDETVRHIQSFIPDTHNQIRLFLQTHSGVSVARNLGIREAQGLWVMFVDSDDLMINGWQESVFDAICSLPESDVIIFTETHPSGKISAKDCLQSCLSTSTAAHISRMALCGPISKIYNRKYLMERNLSFTPDLCIGEDMIFNAEVFSSMPDLYVYQKSIYMYRKNMNSVTNSKNNSFLNNELLYHHRLANVLDSSILSEDEKVAILEENCLGGLLGIIRNCENPVSSLSTFATNSEWSDYRIALNRILIARTSFPFYEKIVLQLLIWRTPYLATLALSLTHKLKYLVYSRRGGSSLERI